MISTAIELHFDCRNCESPVHVNAMTDQVPCSSCDHVTTFDWEQWKSVLEDSFDEIPDYAHGRGGRSQTFAGSGPNTDIMYSRYEPYCYACKTDFDAAALVAAGATDVSCAQCGEQWNARAPNEALRKHFPQIRYLFAEDPKLIADAFGNLPAAVSPTGGKPVVFACPACGGGLKVDGSERMVPCEHCASSVYLPDDLWRRLHPVQTKRRWFIWWDEGRRERDESRFPVESEVPELAPPSLVSKAEPMTPAAEISLPAMVPASSARRSSQVKPLALVFVAVGFLLLMIAGGAAYFLVAASPEPMQPQAADAVPGHE